MFSARPLRHGYLRATPLGVAASPRFVQSSTTTIFDARTMYASTSKKPKSPTRFDFRGIVKEGASIHTRTSAVQSPPCSFLTMDSYTMTTAGGAHGAQHVQHQGHPDVSHLASMSCKANLDACTRHNFTSSRLTTRRGTTSSASRSTSCGCTSSFG